jgi:hypothetical protein
VVLKPKARDDGASEKASLLPTARSAITIVMVFGEKYILMFVFFFVLSNVVAWKV